MRRAARTRSVPNVCVLLEWRPRSFLPHFLATSVGCSNVARVPECIIYLSLFSLSYVWPSGELHLSYLDNNVSTSWNLPLAHIPTS